MSGNWFLYCTWENVWKDIEALKTDKGYNHEQYYVFKRMCTLPSIMFFNISGIFDKDTGHHPSINQSSLVIFNEKKQN